MATCSNHPDRETRFLCSKHSVYLCEECRRCRDPKLYCKFRSACPIWFLDKERARQERDQQRAAGPPDE